MREKPHFWTPEDLDNLVRSTFDQETLKLEELRTRLGHQNRLSNSLATDLAIARVCEDLGGGMVRLRVILTPDSEE